MRILLVDDNEDSLKSLSVVVSDLGHEPVPVAGGEEAVEKATREYYPMVITDIRMPRMDGLELLSRLKNIRSGRYSDIVLITGHGDMETAVEALRKGAYDYLNKPINARELAAVIDRCAEHQALLAENLDLRTQFDSRVQEAVADIQEDLSRTKSILRQNAGIGRIIAASAAMLRILEECEIYHNDPDVPVLIEGETGTGKEIIAKLIHYGKDTPDTPFIAINCSAIPAQLFESELFGHAPGAYTGSTRSGSPGKLEMAESGALFLDEISEMPLNLQPKLLRVLEERSFYRVGGVQKKDFKARVICAANRNLSQLVDQGAFRRDLFHRLKVGHIKIPPLRERKEDIEPLAYFFLHREARKKKKSFKSLHPKALELLESLPWEGNVRELENALERAVLTQEGLVLLPQHLDFLLGDQAPESASSAPGSAITSAVESTEDIHLPESGLNLEDLTQRIINKALDKFDGNKTQTAKYLGISRYALHRRLKKDEE